MTVMRLVHGNGHLSFAKIGALLCDACKHMEYTHHAHATCAKCAFANPPIQHRRSSDALALCKSGHGHKPCGALVRARTLQLRHGGAEHQRERATLLRLPHHCVHARHHLSRAEIPLSHNLVFA